MEEKKQDYIKTYKTRAEKNKKYNAYISKDTAEKFDKKLKENKLTFSVWLRERIDKYLRNN